MPEEKQGPQGRAPIPGRAGTGIFTEETLRVMVSEIREDVQPRDTKGPRGAGHLQQHRTWAAASRECPSRGQRRRDVHQTGRGMGNLQEGQEAPGVSEGRSSREDPGGAGVRALGPHGGRKTRLGRNELPADSRHPESPRGWGGTGQEDLGQATSGGDLGDCWAGRPDVSAASARGQSRMSHCGRR